MKFFFCIILSVAPPARGLFRVPECSNAICSTSNQTHGHVQGSTNRGLYDERPRLGRMVWIFYEQVFGKVVIRVRKGSYSSLMHAIHRECARETDRALCILCEKGKKKTDSKRNAGFQPISIPLLSCHFHLIPKTQSPRVIVNKTPEKAEKSRKHKNQRLRTEGTREKSQNPHLRNTFCIVSSGVLLFSPFVRFVCRVVDCSCC